MKPIAHNQNLIGRKRFHCTVCGRYYKKKKLNEGAHDMVIHTNGVKEDDIELLPLTVANTPIDKFDAQTIVKFRKDGVIK